MASNEKYYDPKTYSPRNEYPRNDGTKTYLKNIRITKEENDNWDSKAIHEFLQGLDKSNDSIRISVLKRYLKGLYDIMENKFSHFELEKAYSPEEMELLLKIEEIVGKWN